MFITKRILLLIAITLAHLKLAQSHEMQHGFVLSADDKFASHLVASGHHSRQTEILGTLSIPSPEEQAFYQERKMISETHGSYFVFQAQNLDLPSLEDGTLLHGHIIESKKGKYEPQNIIVKAASFYVNKVLLNIENPFFASDKGRIFSLSSFPPSRPRLLPSFNSVHDEKNPHCCETQTRPCNWKC